MSRLPVPEHATQNHSIAHQNAFVMPMTAVILGEDPGILESVGRYLRAAAKSHPLARSGHWHSQINKVRVGAYSFMLTLEEGHKDHPDARYLPREYRHTHDPSGGNGTDSTKATEVGEFTDWYWHLSMVQFHEDSGAQLPVPMDQAIKLMEAILLQEVWLEWLHYAVSAAEPLVIHGFVPFHEEETEDGI